MTIECSQNVHSMFISKAIITLYKNFANSFVRDFTDLRGLGYWKRDDAGGQNSSAGKMKKCRFFESTTEKNVEIYGKRIGICAFCRKFGKIDLKIVKNDVQDICHVLY